MDHKRQRNTNRPLDHRFPKHALISGTCFVVSFSLVQSVCFDGLNSTFDPVLMSFVFACVICDAEKLFHPFQKSRLERLTLISDEHDRMLVKRDDSHTS